ncbi:MAG: hypothetical protein C0483_22180 [Pirellula sp.]|nr:hypothetical protein [Pirellula sp.]
MLNFGRATEQHRYAGAFVAERWEINFGKPGPPSERLGSKFGGQPDWIESPAWPMGRTLGEPMRFLAQIELPAPLRVGGHRMAYLFLSDHDSDRGNAPYLDDSGDNAVILQGGVAFTANVETIVTTKGPTLRRGIQSRFGGSRIEDDPASPEVQVPVDLRATMEPAPLSESEIADLYAQDERAYLAYSSTMSPSKVGGNPYWLQGPETPLGGPWRLLAQLDVAHVPCWVPFDGWLYAFVATDGSGARMLYQIT